MKQNTALEILKTGENVFLTGSAGTGKTYLIAKYLKYLKDRKIKVSVVAPTGIAASHLNGQTIHSFFGLGIRSFVDEYYIDSLQQKKYLNERMRKLKVLIIDEVSMISPEIFESMDKILKAFRFSDEPFGGVQVILSGDFFQLTSISKEKREKKFIFQSYLWDELKLKICYLEEKFRQDDDILIKILDEIRRGEVSEESMNVFRSRYRRRLSDTMRPTKLYTHNVDVDRINNNELELLDGNPVYFDAVTKGSKKNIQKIFSSSLVLEKLILKKEATVIFIKNDYEKGIVNGTLGKIIDFDKKTNNPIVEIFSGRKIEAEKKEWTIEDSKGKITATVSQIPLRLAWAITIHKSQGMTLDAVEMDLSKTFEKGQGYVALSRLRNIQGLRIMGLNKTALEVAPEVLEIDKEFQNQSKEDDNEIKKKSLKEKKKLEENFLKKIGGKKIDEDDEDDEFNPEEFFKRDFEEKAKESTYEKTFKLMKNEKDLISVSEKRNISFDTILKHLKYLMLEMEDTETLYKFKPKDFLLKRVKRAVNIIKNKNNKKDFLENGEVKLKSIYNFLESEEVSDDENDELFNEVTYNDIKLSLIFLDDCDNKK